MRAEEARAMNLEAEIGRLSLVTDGLRKERDKLVSAIYDGADEESHSSQQEGRSEMCLQERLGFERMKFRQLEREVAAMKAWDGTQRVAKQSKLKQVRRSTSLVFFSRVPRLGARVGRFFYII